MREEISVGQRSKILGLIGEYVSTGVVEERRKGTVDRSPRFLYMVSDIYARYCLIKASNPSPFFLNLCRFKLKRKGNSVPFKKFLFRHNNTVLTPQFSFTST